MQPSKCLICHRPTSHFHYNVASCKGCKTFFRRVYVSKVRWECELNQDCFDGSKRAQFMLRCKACRYQKCLAVGMSPMAMKLQGHPETEEESIPSASTLSVSKFTTIQNVIDSLSYLEERIEEFRFSAFNPHFSMFNGVEQVLKETCYLGVAKRYGPMPSWPLSTFSPLPLPPSMVRDVQPAPMNHEPDKKRWFFFNLITTIEYCKTFPFLYQLERKDQVSLVKYVVVAVMNLHLTWYSVAKRNEAFIQPDGSEQPLQDELHYSIVSMCFGPLHRCKITREEYVLLKAICLCNPTAPNLSPIAQSIISQEREKYSNALLSHCLSHNQSNGPTHFMDLISILEVLERQQSMQKNIHCLYTAPLVARFPKEHIKLIIEEVMSY